MINSVVLWLLVVPVAPVATKWQLPVIMCVSRKCLTSLRGKREFFSLMVSLVLHLCLSRYRAEESCVGLPGLEGKIGYSCRTCHCLCSPPRPVPSLPPKTLIATQTSDLVPGGLCPTLGSTDWCCPDVSILTSQGAIKMFYSMFMTFSTSTRAHYWCWRRIGLGPNTNYGRLEKSMVQSGYALSALNN